jgi:hypothetical protein
MFESRQHVAANDAGLAAETLGDDGVALVRHGRRALLPGREILFSLEHLGPLVVTHLKRDLLDGAREQREGRHELRVAITLNDLRRDGSETQTEQRYSDLLDLRVDVGVGAHGARDLAHRNLLNGALESLQPPLHLEGPQAQDHAERDGLGVHPVGAADHHGVAVLERPALERAA